MSNRKISEKYNDSCLKIFDLIKLLSKGETPFAEVIKLFADENGEISQISNVVLNKYMNTLKISGIQVKKEKNTYYLLKMPFSLSLSEKELYIVALIKSAMNFLPKGKTKTSIEEFVENLEKRYDYETKKLSTVVAATRNYNLSFYFMKFEKQIANCEQYCQDGYKIDMYYIDQDGNHINMIAVPQEVKYLDDIVCLNVFNPQTNLVFDIPIGSIKNIVQLNQKTEDEKQVLTTVIFKLKGDLAKRYKLRDWEKTTGLDENGDLTVINSGEDLQTLATRLFKYNESCVVISPKYLRNSIAKRIDKTLKNYD